MIWVLKLIDVVHFRTLVKPICFPHLFLIVFALGTECSHNFVKSKIYEKIGKFKTEISEEIVIGRRFGVEGTPVWHHCPA